MNIPSITIIDNPRIENVSIKEASERLGKSQQFVRVALQNGTAPFGMAVKMKGSRYSYHISRHSFEKYLGTQSH